MRSKICLKLTVLNGEDNFHLKEHRFVAKNKTKIVGTSALCVYMCACVRKRERERGKNKDKICQRFQKKFFFDLMMCITDQKVARTKLGSRDLIFVYPTHR